MKRTALSTYAWGVLAYNLAVILWGAWVRITGSGAGCGRHWPVCNGQVVPRSPSVETLIEFTHRLTSGLDLLLVAGLVLWVFRTVPRGEPVRRASAYAGAFLVVEALLGAGLVLFALVADDASMARAWAMSLHLVNTLLLLGSLTLTAWHASGGGPLRAGEHRSSLRSLVVAFVGLALIAVTGGIAALGDTLFPPATLAEGIRQELTPGAHLLLRLRMLHPIVAVLVGIWLLALAATLRHEGPRARRAATGVMALVVAQWIAGLVNVFLLAPGWLQLVHLLLADAVLIALVVLAAEALSAPGRAPQLAAEPVAA